jgi:hypothetical protein
MPKSPSVGSERATDRNLRITLQQRDRCCLRQSYTGVKHVNASPPVRANRPNYNYCRCICVAFCCKGAPTPIISQIEWIEISVNSVAAPLKLHSGAKCEGQ